MGKQKNRQRVWVEIGREAERSGRSLERNILNKIIYQKNKEKQANKTNYTPSVIFVLNDTG